MIIRPADAGDHATWARMLARLHAPEASAAQFLDEIPGWLALDQPMRCWLACNDAGEPIGMVDARLRNYAEGAPEGYVPYVEDLWVDPEHRGCGVGRALIEAVKQWARGEGYRWLGSDALLDADDSHAFHRKAGFEEIERLVVFGMKL